MNLKIENWKKNWKLKFKIKIWKLKVENGSWKLEVEVTGSWSVKSELETVEELLKGKIRGELVSFGVVTDLGERPGSKVLDSLYIHFFLWEPLILRSNTHPFRFLFAILSSFHYSLPVPYRVLFIFLCEYFILHLSV